MKTALFATGLMLALIAPAGADVILEGDGTPTGTVVGVGNTEGFNILMVTTGGTVDDGFMNYMGGTATLLDTQWFMDQFNSEFVPLLSTIEAINGMTPGSINQIFGMEFDDPSLAPVPSGLGPTFPTNGTLATFNAVDAPVTLQLIDSNALTSVGSSITLIPAPGVPALFGVACVGAVRRRRR
jgi:hypothetical protein